MNTKDDSEINIGIDTGQAILDIVVRPQSDYQSFENNPEGIRAAIRFIKPFKPTRILIEATGRLEMAFFCAAHKAKLPVCVCNPIKVRKFAEMTGILAKTDKFDAQVIAHYGETDEIGSHRAKARKTKACERSTSRAISVSRDEHYAKEPVVADAKNSSQTDSKYTQKDHRGNRCH